MDIHQHTILTHKMKEPKSKKNQQWKPLAASYCCSADDHAILGNMSRFRSSKSDLSSKSGSAAAAPMAASFRKLSFSDSSLRSSSARINEDLAQCFAGDLLDFQVSELRGATQSFAAHFLLGEGGFGRVHKGYLEEGLRPGLKPQPVAVKLLNIEGLQGHREWLVSFLFQFSFSFFNFIFLFLIFFCLFNFSICFLLSVLLITHRDISYPKF